MAQRKPYVTRRCKVLIDQIVNYGKKRADAAKIAGLTDEAARKAMKRPIVLAYMRDQQQLLREGESARSIARVANLADNSESDHVKLGANELLLKLNGELIERHENRHIHEDFAPGLTIVYANRPGDAQEAPLIEGQAVRVGDGKPFEIPDPTPHPAMAREEAARKANALKPKR